MGCVPGLTSLAGLLRGLVRLGKSLALELTHCRHLPEDCSKVFHLPWHSSPIPCVVPIWQNQPPNPFPSLLDQVGKQCWHPSGIASVPIYWPTGMGFAGTS